MVLEILTGLWQTVITVLNSILETVREWTKRIYDVIHDTITFLMGYVRLITSSFPFDNPKKTMMLSIIFLFIVVGLVIAFSGSDFKKKGVDKMETKQYTLADFTGAEAVGGGTQTTTTIVSPPGPGPGPAIACYSDQDCKTRYEGEELKCCYPDQYDGYYCKGQCLRYSDLSRDACKHPNLCYNINDIDVTEYIHGDSTSCLGKNPTPDQYCKQYASEEGTIYSESKCCQVKSTSYLYSACYGYCTKSSGECTDHTACYEENEPVTVGLSGVDT